MAIFLNARRSMMLRSKEFRQGNGNRADRN
jgi:hypothetical protein